MTADVKMINSSMIHTCITETNRIQLVLFGMQNRVLGAYLTAIIGSSFQYNGKTCMHALVCTFQAPHAEYDAGSVPIWQP
jgi:hypothetical protein